MQTLQIFFIFFSGIIACMGLNTLKAHAHLCWKSQTLLLERTKQSGVRALFLIVYFPIAMLMTLGKDYSKHSRGLYFAFAFSTKTTTGLSECYNLLPEEFSYFIAKRTEFVVLLYSSLIGDTTLIFKVHEHYCKYQSSHGYFQRCR